MQVFIVPSKDSYNSPNNCSLRRYLLLFNIIFYMFTVRVAICGSYHCIATRSGTCELRKNKKIGQQKREALQDDIYFLVHAKSPNHVYTTATGTNTN